MIAPNDQTVIRAARSAKPLLIKIELDNGVTFSFEQDKLPMSVGRGQDCDIRIPQGDVSRLHCELFLRNGHLFIKDISTNGTIVGNKRIKGEAVAIEGPTVVAFSEDAMMTVSPTTSSSVIRGTRFDLKRRGEDRRRFERRSNVMVVDFERRSDATRRTDQRRVAASG